MLEALIQKIGELIKAIDDIEDVYVYEIEKFETTPCCTISPSSNEDDYKTSIENLRIYAFDVRIYVNRTVAPTGKNPEENADKVMRRIVDDVLNTLDRNYKLSGLEAPAGYTFVGLSVRPSAWGVSGREAEYRAVEIDVRCKVNVNVDQIL